MIQIKPHISGALRNSQLQRNLRHTLGKTLHSRNLAVAEVGNWESLREHARLVKRHALSRLDHYLEEFERSVVNRGGKVIWSNDAREANQAVLDILRERNLHRIAKSKTMLSEETHLNSALEAGGFEVVETDLGEYIVQLSGEAPSHIVAPALHKSKEEVAALFSAKLGMEPTSDVQELTATARRVLRRRFLEAEAGISGVNFGIAETGTIVIVENEGNARLATSVPRIHIALMGIEKVIPRTADLSVFLKLLTRSATGQPMSSYVNLITGPRRVDEVDGPDELYVILVDNGRSRIHADPYLRQTLSCIRCGACQNICPVFQRIGGHAYESVYQGPIGAILTPQLLSEESVPDHPFASSLCGACKEVCPVKIEIPEILLHLRQRAHRNGRAGSRFEKLAMMCWAWFMSSSRRFRLAGWAMRWGGRFGIRGGRARVSVPPFSEWEKHRDLPEIPPKSLRQLLREQEKSQ